MGYPLDTAAQNAALDALLSRDVSGIPTTFEVALFTDHPLLGGTELASTGGYARATVDANGTDWAAAASGHKDSVPVSFGTAFDAWSDTATHAVLISAADSTTRWFVVKLGDEVDVSAAGTAVVVNLSAFWNTQSL